MYRDVDESILELLLICIGEACEAWLTEFFVFFEDAVYDLLLVDRYRLEESLESLHVPEDV